MVDQYSRIYEAMLRGTCDAQSAQAD
jgi:hypothetical protein